MQRWEDHSRGRTNAYVGDNYLSIVKVAKQTQPTWTCTPFHTSSIPVRFTSDKVAMLLYRYCD